MNKKTILIFLGGVLTATLCFGASSLLTVARNKPVPAPAPLPTEPLLSVSPALVTPLSVSEPPAAIDHSQLKETLLGKLAQHTVLHTVAKGDSLTSISKKYHVTIGLIRQMNGLAGDKLMLGQKLKILDLLFSVVVDKSQNSLILKGGEDVLKQYLVSTGENNSTPVGVFKITDKIVNPTWYKNNKAIPFGDPKNVLGTRWMALDKKSYGIHGTFEPEKLGQQVTDGCVRMKNEDVEELFEVLPAGAEITIVD